MKKVFCIIMIFVMMMAVFTGCGGKEEGTQTSVEQTDSSKSEGNGNTGDTTQQNSEDNVKVKTGQMSDNMGLPENFPKDVIPVMNDANIMSTISNADGFTIIYTTGEKYEDAIKFYQNAMKDASELGESKDENGYVLCGNKENHIIGVNISKSEGENVNVLLNVTTASNDLDSSKSNYFEKGELVDFPESYPVDQFPVLDGDKVTDSSSTESDSEIASYLTVLSNKKMKEIMEYYESTWGKIENKYKQADNESFTLEGEIGKYRIYVYGGIQDDEAKTVEYYVTITEYKE